MLSTEIDIPRTQNRESRKRPSRLALTKSVLESFFEPQYPEQSHNEL